MKKKPIIIFFTGLIIGLFITFQYFSDQLISFDDKLGQNIDFKEIISILDTEAFVLNERLSDIEEKVNLITKGKEQNYEDYEELKIEAGQGELIEGNGLEIRISGSVNGSDLRDLINVLREVGVRAIAIGSQRVIYSTPIIDLSNAILVGNTRFKSPLSIFVIGDINQISSIISVSPILKEFFEKSIAGDVKVELIEKEVVIPKM